jgi:mono/diheme cytochrome c family protein
MISMGKRELTGIFTVVLIIGVFYVLQAGAEGMDEYNQTCKGCHGQTGIDYAVYIDGSECSLETIDDIVECILSIDNHENERVQACDDTCILDTSTYVYNELLLQIGSDNYTNMCSQCHGDDGMGNNPIDGSDCDLNSLQGIVNCYPGIGAHGSISSCNDTCVWHTNRHIFVALLGNDDVEPADDSNGNDNDWVIRREIAVENDVWLHCFIGASTK